MFNKNKMTVFEILIIYIRNSFLPTAALIAAKLTLALLSFLFVIITSNFINAVININSGGVRPAIYYAILIVTLMITQQLAAISSSFLRTVLRGHMQPIVEKALVEKISRLPYAFVESDATQHVLKRVTGDPEELFYNILFNRVDIICFFISNLSVMFILVAQATWMALLVLAIFILSGYNAVMRGCSLAIKIK